MSSFVTGEMRIISWPECCIGPDTTKTIYIDGLEISSDGIIRNCPDKTKDPIPLRLRKFTSIVPINIPTHLLNEIKVKLRTDPSKVAELATQLFSPN